MLYSWAQQQYFFLKSSQQHRQHTNAARDNEFLKKIWENEDSEELQASINMCAPWLEQIEQCDINTIMMSNDDRVQFDAEFNKCGDVDSCMDVAISVDSDSLLMCDDEEDVLL